MKIKTMLGSVLLASFTLVPVSAVLAEEATTTATTSEVTVVATTTAVTPAVTTAAPVPALYNKEAMEQAREDYKKLFEQKREQLKDMQEKARESAKNLKEQQKEDWKDLKNASGTRPTWSNASNTAKYAERKAEQVKKNLEKATADLLKVTARLGTLGTQIKAIVAGQASSSESIITAMKNEEGRGSWKKFMFGADYKNIGQVISGVAKTQATLVQLNNKVSTMASSTEKTALLANIEVQKAEIVALEQYVKDNINKFSLFGWFVQKFNK